MSKDDFNFKINKKDLKIRKHWKRNPGEQVEDPKKNGPYNRAQAEREWKEQLEEEAEDLDFNF